MNYDKRISTYNVKREDIKNSVLKYGYISRKTKDSSEEKELY